MRPAAALLPLLLAAAPAWADRLVLPAAVERTGSIEAQFIADPPLSAPAEVAVDWTDALGRHVAHFTLIANPDAPASVRLDLRHAVAMGNTLRSVSIRDGTRHEAAAGFIARPAPGVWDDFQLISYAEQSPARHTAMRALGITGVKVFGHRVPFSGADVAPRIAAPLAGDFRWYVENIATDFYSPYHMWTPEHGNDVTWQFTQAQARHQADPRDLSVFERRPSLSDPAWIARIGSRLAAHVRAHGDYRPLYYSLGDEPGIADLAAAWDFDRSPLVLADFRDWLRRRRGSLAAVNAAWGTAFPSWDSVMPETTTAAMGRTDGRYAAWNDHKAFMDASFAAAIRAGTEALHAADPAALAAIEGGQIPGWGGWNYAELAGAVDLMEIYDVGQNVEIARSQNPGLIPIGTVFGHDEAARRQIWHAALGGSRGLILWDDDDSMLRDDGTPGPAGAALAPALGALRGGLGALLIASPPPPSPVAALYSPASFRLRWLLDHRAAGDAWTRRSSELEGEDNAIRAAMRSVAAAFGALGLAPRWITPEQLAAGLPADIRVLALPGALALSDAEITAIAAFAGRGGQVVSEGETGAFDGDANCRAGPALRPGLATALDPANLRRSLATAGIVPEITAEDAARITLRRNGAATLAGIEFPPDISGPRTITLAAPAFVRDLARDPAVWTRTDRLTFEAGTERPALLALLPAPPVPPSILAPSVARAGDRVTAELRLPGAGVLHVELRDPSGRLAGAYSGNARVDGGRVTWAVPFALDDAAGEWVLRVLDVLGGGSARAVIRVIAGGRK